MSPPSNGAPLCGIRSSRGEFLAGGITVDRTGLTGYYQITLTFAPISPADAGDAPTLFTAMQEQLALKLEPSRAPLHTLVIDLVDGPSEQ